MIIARLQNLNQLARITDCKTTFHSIRIQLKLRQCPFKNIMNTCLFLVSVLLPTFSVFLLKFAYYPFILIDSITTSLGTNSLFVLMCQTSIKQTRGVPITDWSIIGTEYSAETRQCFFATLQSALYCTQYNEQKLVKCYTRIIH